MRLMPSVVPRTKMISLSDGRVDKGRHFSSGGFINIGRYLRKVVYASVYIGILVGVIMREGIDDRAGFLGCGTIVEVHERLPLHLLAQNGKVRADAAHVKGRCSGARLVRVVEVLICPGANSCHVLCIDVFEARVD